MDNLFNAFSFRFWQVEKKKVKEEKRILKEKKEKVEKLKKHFLPEDEEPKVDLAAIVKMVQEYHQQMAEANANPETGKPDDNATRTERKQEEIGDKSSDEEDLYIEIKPEIERLNRQKIVPSGVSFGRPIGERKQSLPKSYSAGDVKRRNGNHTHAVIPKDYQLYH